MQFKTKSKRCKCRRECKKFIKQHECRKDYMWNPRYLLRHLIKVLDWKTPKFCNIHLNETYCRYLVTGCEEEIKIIL